MDMQTKITFPLVTTVLGLALAGCAHEAATPREERAPAAPAPAKEQARAPAAPAQLEGAQFHGSDEPATVARHGIAGVVRVIDSFVAAKQANELDAFQLEAGQVYAGDAQIFQSQEFMTPDKLGPAGFVHMVDFLYTQLGEGKEALHPLQVCNVYAYYPDDSDPDTVEWVMTSQTSVPTFGALVATAKMRATRQPDGWRLTYHDYFDAPAPGEDCSGAQVRKIHDDWLCQVSPDAAGCSTRALFQP